MLTNTLAHRRPDDYPDEERDTPIRRQMVECQRQRILIEIAGGATAHDYDYCDCGKPAIVTLQGRAMCVECAPMLRRKFSHRGRGNVRGRPCKPSRPVQDDAGNVYPSISAAVQETGIGEYAIRQAIRVGCRGGGRNWQWAAEKQRVA